MRGHFHVPRLNLFPSLIYFSCILQESAFRISPWIWLSMLQRNLSGQTLPMQEVPLKPARLDVETRTHLCRPTFLTLISSRSVGRVSCNQLHLFVLHLLKATYFFKKWHNTVLITKRQVALVCSFQGVFCMEKSMEWWRIWIGIGIRIRIRIFALCFCQGIGFAVRYCTSLCVPHWVWGQQKEES